MKYCLRKAVIDRVPDVEISAQDFNNLKISRHVLSNAFEIEQKYEILISNFLELEKEILHIAVNNVVRSAHTYAEHFETVSVLNTRLVNLLTATRLYFDQLPNNLRNCDMTQKGFIADFKSKCSEEYDSHFEYRFMEALRNHVQHQGIPIHNINQNARWTSHCDDGLLEHSVQLLAKRSNLQENIKFKKSVLKEITADIDLIAASRQYIESISSINEFVRELISEGLTSARATIESAHQSYS